MLSTSLATEMTSVIRGFGTGVESQGRALSTSMRNLVSASGVGETSRARIAQDVQIPTTQVLSWIAFALRASSTLLEREARDLETGFREPAHHVIVDRHLTRC